MRGQLTTYERRESIRLYLIRVKFTTAGQLACMFNVTRQTIVNDIMFLSGRLPIATRLGVGGGIFLDSNYEKPKEFLTIDEETLLLRIASAVNEKEKLIIHNIINKFSISFEQYL